MAMRHRSRKGGSSWAAFLHFGVSVAGALLSRGSGGCGADREGCALLLRSTMRLCQRVPHGGRGVRSAGVRQGDPRGRASRHSCSLHGPAPRGCLSDKSAPSIARPHQHAQASQTSSGEGCMRLTFSWCSCRPGKNKADTIQGTSLGRRGFF